MNCKPGDLALIVKAATLPEAVGRIVQVTGPSPMGSTSWTFEPTFVVNGITYWSVDDHNLRRIDNPSDDAVDEVIQRIGTPHKEVA